MDTLTPSNYFERRDDCAPICRIGAGLTGAWIRHHADCAIVADTGHAYREAVAVEAERLRFGDGPQAYAMTVGRHEDETVIGVHITNDPADAEALALHMSALRARQADANRYGPGSISSDVISVRAEPVDLLDTTGTPITGAVRLEIVR